MTAEQTRDAIKSLSLSQGFYGRLLRSIDEREDATQIYEDLGKDCNDVLDLVFKLES